MRCRTARALDHAGPRGRAAAAAGPDALERHVEGCEGCRREQTAYAALDRALGLLTARRAAVPPRLEQDTLPSGPARRGRRRRSGTARRLALAAGRRARARRRGRPGAGRARGAAAGRAGQLDAPGRARRVEACRSRAVPRRERRDAARAAPRGSMPSEPPPELAARPDLFVNLPDAAQPGEAPALRGHPDDDARRAATRASRTDDVPARRCCCSPSRSRRRPCGARSGTRAPGSSSRPRSSAARGRTTSATSSCRSSGASIYENRFQRFQAHAAAGAATVAAELRRVSRPGPGGAPAVQREATGAGSRAVGRAEHG